MSVGEGGLIEVQVLSQILNTLIGEEVVVITPVEVLVQVSSGVKRLGDHHNVEVRDSVEVAMLLNLGVLLDNDDAVFKDSLIDGLLGRGWNKNH